MKTYKFADPIVFLNSTSTNIKFRSQCTIIEIKLKVNIDHFLTLELYKTYVTSQLASAIYNQIVPRLNNNDNNASFNNSNNILDYLKNIYRDSIYQE